MKLKGINSFEQHVEKAFAAVAVLAILALVAWKFLSPDLHRVGSDLVAPSAVDDRLSTKAGQLQAKLGSEGVTISAGEGTALPLAVPELNRAIAADIAPSKALRQTSPNFNARLVKAGAVMADSWYRVPAIPPVQMSGVSQTADAVTAEAATAAKALCPSLASRPDFEKIEGPLDIVWTTPYARLDLKALRAEFVASDTSASPPKAQVPGVWFQEVPHVVDVVFERRERKDDGSWSAPVVVPVFADRPAEINFRDRLSSATVELRDEVFALLGNDANQRDVLQPNFFDTVNDAFVSPQLLVESPDAAAAQATADAGTLRRRLQMRTELQRKMQQLEKLRAELDKLGGVWDEEVERKREEDRKREERDRKQSEKDQSSGSGGGGGGSGLGGAMGGKNNADAGNAERDERKRAADRKSKSVMFRRLQGEVAVLEKQLGVEPSRAGEQKPAAPTTIASMDEVLVWGHDMDVAAGRTYQYRCVVRAYNPFFGKGNQLVKEQDATGIAGEFVLASIASDWSASIEVSSEVRFFVTGSTPGDGGLSTASAQIEIYKLQGGIWRRDSVSVNPGDRIGGIARGESEGIDFTTEYMLVDVIEDLAPRGAKGAAAAVRSGIAVVAPVSGGRIETRIPALEAADQERQRLNELSEAAKAAAASAPPAAPGS